MEFIPNGIVFNESLGFDPRWLAVVRGGRRWLGVVVGGGWRRLEVIEVDKEEDKGEKDEEDKENEDFCTQVLFCSPFLSSWSHALFAAFSEFLRVRLVRYNPRWLSVVVRGGSRLLEVVGGGRGGGRTELSLKALLT
ncbi:uncharacterized protein [Neodiprion pinetum]|uniref:uncharacterized protein n=1 Tax=Neodiprion pinetum TaxID=441929 RepID=UPI0037243286